MADIKNPKGSESSAQLAALAKEAVSAFREENAAAFQELVTAYNGKSADIALYGHGKFNIAVAGGELQVVPNELRGEGATGRGATTPETFIALLEGKLTPLEAYFKGDLVVRANSAELHTLYGYFTRFSDAALRSKKLQQVVVGFRQAFGQQ
jgi:hypothetical protein